MESRPAKQGAKPTGCFSATETAKSFIDARERNTEREPISSVRCPAGRGRGARDRSAGPQVQQTLHRVGEDRWCRAWGARGVESYGRARLRILPKPTRTSKKILILLLSRFAWPQHHARHDLNSGGGILTHGIPDVVSGPLANVAWVKSARQTFFNDIRYVIS